MKFPLFVHRSEIQAGLFFGMDTQQGWLETDADDVDSHANALILRISLIIVM